jgi:hypothetical protein
MNDDIREFGTGLGQRVIARLGRCAWGMRHPEKMHIGGDSGMTAKELQSPAGVMKRSCEGGVGARH